MNHLTKLLTKLQKTRRNHSSKSSARKRFGNRLSLERLEERSLMAGFNFADFSDIDGLQLVGSASINTDHELRLTPVSPTIPGVPIHDVRGGAWYVADKSPVAAGFSTTFQFRATNTDEARIIWGFAFVIQNSNPYEIRDGGSGMGYAGQMPDGIPNSVAVEFDNNQNPNFNDPSASHVSVHTNGTGPNSAHEDYSLGSANASGFILDDGQVHTAKIDYTPGTLRVFLDNLSTPLLTVPLDLGTKLNTDAGRAWLGFTAGSMDLMDILSWDAQLVDNFVIADHPTVIEGPAAATTNVSFAVQRVGDLSGQLVVNWSAVNGTANSASDFTANSGEITFGPGESQKTVVVNVIGDNLQESHESFSLVLSSGNLAYPVIAGKATILNDDSEVSISDASAVEASQQFASLGAFVDRANSGNMTSSTGMALGPDGHLYVGSSLTHEILKFEGTTGAFLGEFISAGNGVEFPAGEGLTWHDSVLYVLCRDSAKVLKFDANGNSLGEFIPSGSGGLQFPKGMVRGPDGTWFVSSANVVLRYGADGTSMGALSVPNGELNTPRGLLFGPDGHLYVASENNSSVIRFQVNGGNVSFDRVFVSSGSGGLKNPGALLFRNGSLLVSSQGSNEVLSYYATTGAFQGTVVSAGQGGLLMPRGLLLDAQSNLLVGGRLDILRYGPASQAAFTVNLSVPSAIPVTANYATVSSTATTGIDVTAALGTITFAPGQTSRTILVQTLDDLTYEGNETFFVNLSNPVGGIIVDSQGVGTIIDNELPPTKFYVVNDGTPDRTYEYSATGTTVENYTINSGNTSPQGVASNLAGDTVWVADKNRKVYVYNNSGGQGGSWSAGSLANNATVEGIATIGTDVWIVDSRSDKVYLYSGAASRTSGSQNAASSFSLNSGNTSPKDIVTDGTHLWVVNDSTTDKVFKYTTAGAYVGSWTITTPGATSPTGITLDPFNLSHLWIVDNGSDRVYQYDAAAGLTSGSKSANSNWLLAPGNTNPQGIADPPPPSASLNTTPGSAASNSSSSSSFMQAPIVSLGASSIERASLRSSLAVTDGVDQFMSRLAKALPAEPTRVSKAQSIPVLSRPRFAEDQNIDLALADEELSDSLDSIANDLLESTIR